MATKIAAPVTREVMVDGRPHLATMTSAGITLREKGKRTTYGPVSFGSILLTGARLMAEEARQEKATRKTIRRVSRGLL